MRTAIEIYDELSAPFAADEIDWRIGSTNQDKTQGMALAYIDARAVMDRLDTVCGPNGWQCNYLFGSGSSVVCNLGIFMDGSWVWKADGAGATDVEGEKGALSVYGLGRFPVTLYREQWEKLLGMGDDIRSFIQTHDSELKKKET